MLPNGKSNRHSESTDSLYRNLRGRTNGQMVDPVLVQTPLGVDHDNVIIKWKTVSDDDIETVVAV